MVALNQSEWGYFVQRNVACPRSISPVMGDRLAIKWHRSHRAGNQVALGGRLVRARPGQAAPRDVDGVATRPGDPARVRIIASAELRIKKFPSGIEFYRGRGELTRKGR